MDLLHVAVLSAFAVAQPLYARLAERPHFLVDLKTTPVEIALTCLLLSLGVPAILALAELLARLISKSARQAMHAVIVFVLLTCLGLPIAKSLILPGLLVGLLALGMSAASTWWYCKARAARLLVTLASPGVVLFPALFLWNSPIAGFFWNRPLLQLEARNAPPVVFLVFDEFCGLSLLNANKTIDAERFPALSRLAGTATWYRNATTVHPDTSHAVPALLSGRYPLPGPAPVAEQLPLNLFSVIDATGRYEMAVFEPVSRIAVPRRGRESAAYGRQTLPEAQELLDTLWRVYLRDLAPVELSPHLPAVRRLWFGEYETRVVPRERRRGLFRFEWSARRDQQFEHMLDCITASETPALYFQHLLLPHVPWCYLPDGQRYANDGGDWTMLNFDTHSQLTGVWSNDDWFIAQCQQRYLLQLMYVDRLVGRLIDRLRALELFDRCLIIVTADHGTSFRPRVSRRQPEAANLAEILSVPLFIKYPGQQEGRIDDRNVESVDLLPTVASVLGIELPRPVDGHSLLEDPPPPRATKRVMREGALVEVDPRVVQRSAFPQEQARLFPPGREGLFAIGPHLSLHGRDVAELRVESRATTAVRVSPPPLSLGEQPGNLVVPLLIEGEFLGSPLDAAESIAAVVDGKIAATTQTFISPGLRNRFALLLPDRLAGQLPVEPMLYRIIEADDGARLEPLRVELRKEESHRLPTAPASVAR
jgi:hypothetical protein